jgi:hypothetical protein
VLFRQKWNAHKNQTFANQMMYENIAAKPLAAAKVLECALQGHGEYPAGVFLSAPVAA